MLRCDLGFDLKRLIVVFSLAKLAQAERQALTERDLRHHLLQDELTSRIQPMAWEAVDHVVPRLRLDGIESFRRFRAALPREEGDDGNIGGGSAGH
jgi:hypothetical protein